MDDATISALPMFLKPAEVADLLRVSPETVIHWCKTGVIQDAKRLTGPGGERSMYRIPRAEMVRLLADATMAIPGAVSPEGSAADEVA